MVRKRRGKRKKMMEEAAKAEPTPIEETGAEKAEEIEAKPVEEEIQPVSPKPETVSIEDNVYAYLAEHGPSSVFAIAKSLGFERSVVMGALKNLRSKGKIRLG